MDCTIIARRQLYSPGQHKANTYYISLERKYPISASSYNNECAFQLPIQINYSVSKPKHFLLNVLMDNQNPCKIKNGLIKCWFHVITRWWFFHCFQEPRRDIRLRPLNILPLDERETY